MVDQLELLLLFHLPICIPDEIYFEAAEKFAWEYEAEQRPAANLLQKWVLEQKSMGRVSRPDTLIVEVT
jgi:hypothetical protein